MTWVQDGIFAAGGAALPAGWAEFQSQTGISAILHLRPGGPAAFIGPPPAAFLWLGIDDEGDTDLSERRLAGEFIRDCREQGQRLLLHASGGRHRTRWCFVAWRILAGSSVEAALRSAARPPWMAPYRTDEGRWNAFARMAARPPISRRPEGWPSPVGDPPRA